MEQTLAIIKPDAMNLKVADHIIKAIEAAGFFITRTQELNLTPARSRELYSKQEGQPGFRVLTEFMSSGKVKAVVLSKVGAVKAWLAMLGPDDPVQAREVAPGCLRALYGSDSVRNAVHGSLTVEDARREINILFPQGPLQAMIPKEFLLETVLPGLVEALQDMYKQRFVASGLMIARVCSIVPTYHPSKFQEDFERRMGAPNQVPDDPYDWMSHWFRNTAPPPRDLLEDHPRPVLDPKGRLKADKVPHIHDRRLGQPLYEGTWNFRRITDRDPVYGMGQGEHVGVRLVAEGLRRSGHHHLVWINLRDDAFVYFNSFPITVVQDEDGRAPNQVTSRHRVRSLNGYELERIERRLSMEVGMHARGNRGNVQLELSEAELRALPVGAEPPEYPCKEDELLTIRELFSSIDFQGAAFDYHRVPLPMDSAPPEHSFDRIVEAVRHVDVSAALVVQCNTGRDRTTTGMAVAALVWRARSGADPTRIAGYEWDPEAPDWSAGEWSCVMDIVEQLDAEDRPGMEAKRRLDEGGLVNLRQEPLICLQNAEHTLLPPEGMEPRDEGMDYWMRKGIRSLERYIWVYLFAVYVAEEGPGEFGRRFSSWARDNRHLVPLPSQISLT